MATEASFTVPADQFPLGTVFQDLPGVTVTLERIIPAQDVIVPYFWVRGTVVDDIEEAFSDHPGVKAIRLVDSVEDEYLLRVEWTLEHAGVLSTLAETEIPLINAVGTKQQWTFEVRGDERSDIAAFQRRCREVEIPITLTKLHALTPITTATEAELTDTQQEALVLAYDRGYFESPRDDGRPRRRTRNLPAGRRVSTPARNQTDSRKHPLRDDASDSLGHLKVCCITKTKSDCGLRRT